MARSPLTLAAAATAALAQASGVQTGISGVSTLTEDAAGRYDSALVRLDDGSRLVVRVATTADAESDAVSEATALAALTAGVRAMLPFAAPEPVGQARLAGGVARVQTFLPGWRVDGAHIPPGRGVATGLAEAIAGIHDLPSSVVTGAGLPSRTAAQVRTETEQLLDRAEATGRLPFGLLRRWSRAIALDALWRFEPTVVLGGVDPASFTFTDVDGVPTVSGLLTWAGLSVGDPAEDLRWIAGAPDAASDAIAAYGAASGRSPDALLADRARLHAELEFAKWLVHGHDTGSESVMSDAVALLTSLDDSVRDEAPIGSGSVSVDEAIAALGRVPVAATDAVDTSMHTDAYDPGSMDPFDDADPSDPPSREELGDETEPIEFSDWSPDAADARDGDDDRDPDDAARNALRRWTGTA
ncbi:phosphotransferase [Microbacterium sp. EYE_5]|uniref:phosphotransferase n=1 Tax=unclassified Microbacterium TaxID=2609290 RepID=UPI002002A231|nr:MULTISPECIES: phosphotransferase [unclassified Microbacterium]MCK6081019.1 phosphotransferase [Microbacterium sp. EYE_382]MCK6086289.1 phosphotransferase [Microbacterium sp. EYE_384]MCK6124213.1 phosphotransferase [Microbacterium sp. EYE_80]MCK6127122.1 phosphotransferase [Microbacterium sp. EYE_79]MCK6141974.1 phosphotransferase [Microbacterium sp. EYE_39]